MLDNKRKTPFLALLGAVALLLAWRSGLQAVQSHAQGAFTPILAWPIWLPQALMLPGLLLTAAIGFYFALRPNALPERTRQLGRA